MLFLILMVQVLTRMKMNWLGESGPESEWRQTFKRVFCIFVSYVVANTVLQPFSVQNYANVSGTLEPVGPPPDHMLVALNNFISIAFGLYTLIVLMRLRSFIWERNQISEKGALVLRIFVVQPFVDVARWYSLQGKLLITKIGGIFVAMILACHKNSQK